MSWLSKALRKSARKKTGLFSWGDSNLANVLDPSGSLDKGIDSLTSSATDNLLGKGKPGNVAETLGNVPVGYAFYQQKEFIYIIGALVAYKVFFK
tara:strand:- start:507 stop:791 length:285 start_codon:yes stop_codon:yes gene_type:complete